MKQPQAQQDHSQYGTLNDTTPYTPAYMPVIGQLVDPLRDARRAASRDYVLANIAYYTKAFLILAAAGAAGYGTVYGSINADARSHVTPSSVGVCPSGDSTLCWTYEYCENIIRGVISTVFANAARFPANKTSVNYTSMMDAFQFICGGNSNITLAGTVFTPTGGNVCNDVTSNGNGQSNDSGALNTMLTLFAQIIGVEELMLNCKNGDGFGLYTALAVCMAFATAGVLAAGYYFCRNNRAPAHYDFLSAPALQERASTMDIEHRQLSFA